MKKFISILSIVVIVTSCVPSGEQTSKLEELDIFLNEVEMQNLNLVLLFRLHLGLAQIL